MQPKDIETAVNLHIYDKLDLPVIFEGMPVRLVAFVLGYSPKAGEYLFLAKDADDKYIDTKKKFASELRLPFKSWLFLKKIQLKQFIKNKVRNW